MAIRSFEFDNQWGAEELAEALIDAGYPRATRLGDIIDNLEDIRDDADDEITLNCAIDEQDVVDRLGKDRIIELYREMGDGGVFEREVEDGVRYIRTGDGELARAMFARVFDGQELAAFERGLA